MKIIIKSITLRNFKGASNVEINFDERLTSITGDNRTGKTTIFDAFNWLLFGKNSENESKFSIKPLDELNNVISGPGIEHEVIGVFLVNGVEQTFRRVYSEKWVTKRGSSTSVFNGNQESLFINDVPNSLTEYDKVIDRHFNSSIFRVISDPIYFNEVLDWQSRRKLLLSLTESLTEQEIASQHPELDLIPFIFEEGKTLEEKKKEISVKKTKTKEAMDGIPDRLDEIDRSVHKDLRPIEILNSVKKGLEEEIEKNTSLINNVSAAESNKNEKRASLIRKKGQIEEEISKEQNAIRKANIDALSEYENKKQFLEDSIKRIKSRWDLNLESTEDLQLKIENLRAENAGLKERFESKQQEIFDTDSLKCPSCGQDLPESDVEEQRTAFNNFKASELERLKSLAVSNNEKIKKFQESISSNAEALIDIINESKEKDAELIALVVPVAQEENDKTLNLFFDLGEIEEQINAITTESTKEEDKEPFRKALSDAKERLESINQELYKHSSNQSAQARKQELIKQQKTLVAEFGELDRFEYQISQLVKFHIEAIEKSVNILFDGIKFKMFKQQVNSGEKPTCVCLINGVPYSDANTAGQVNAGLQIIKTIQEHHQTFVPVFIDNRERVSEIIPMDCQVINLTVVPGQEELKVS